MISSLGFSALLTPPTTNEALSGIFGSISLTAWICLLPLTLLPAEQIPQLLANYKAQSAEALSMGFLFIWLAGDVSNLSGALFTNLAPTAIALASYFCLADLILITQCSYYNAKNARHRGRRRTSHGEPGTSERSPLLVRRRSSSAGLPGSFRRNDTHEESNIEALRKVVAGEDQTPDTRPWLHNTLALLTVWVVGALGWFVSYKFGAWDSDAGPVTDAPAIPPEEEAAWQIGTVLGYISALCYLCARIPQIIKNYQNKSCEGLALLFFLLSLTGNMAYGLSLLSYSQEPKYLLTALPWLLGSLGTVIEDSIIFVQFRIYSKNSPPQVASSS
ncbi:related to membrane protein [Cephalotrichum gorgonifer]|uniref:Related to membrane protein n=1 Tax=Cephalotrichum gorgonifer TaxID=2041049 RepID=A0AAE8N2K1_9PEZI|nr:related to membrane protein [Cephalotrichum gorgonifer]